mmetsp:Transcript_7169/g.27022  ORF Transcript_7169/g.27022 Transcript_7169/m.27022 type:complete len:224 (-) Transcript_7169:1531-2202(-)
MRLLRQRDYGQHRIPKHTLGGSHTCLPQTRESSSFGALALAGCFFGVGFRLCIVCGVENVFVNASRRVQKIHGVRDESSLQFVVRFRHPAAVLGARHQRRRAVHLQKPHPQVFVDQDVQTQKLKVPPRFGFRFIFVFVRATFIFITRRRLRIPRVPASPLPHRGEPCHDRGLRRLHRDYGCFPNVFPHPRPRRLAERVVQPGFESRETPVAFEVRVCVGAFGD